MRLTSTGTNGCYLYQSRDITENKNYNLKDHILVIAPHEEIVSSDVVSMPKKASD